MSNKSVGNLRKVLAIFFATLSILFASIAVYNKFAVVDEQLINNDEKNIEWNRNIESRARNENKLIFFTTENSKFMPSTQTKKVLATHYLCIKISTETFPADYTILDIPLAKSTRKNNTLKAGILSPNLFPIYLTSDENSLLNNVIIAAAKHLEKNPYILKKIAREAAKLDSLSIDFFHQSYPIPFSKFAFINIENARLFAYFTSNAPLVDKPSIVSENARLAARISLNSPHQFSAKQTLINASKFLCIRTLSPQENNTSKLLFLRAIGELNNLLNDKNLTNFYLKNADVLTQKIANSENVNLCDIALTSSILTNLFEITQNNDFLSRAEQTAKNIAVAISSSNLLPAKIGEYSQASSLEYVLVARAFWDISKYSKIGNWRNLTDKTIELWSNDFMTPFGLWSINSKKSALAKYMRPILTRDAKTPSYLGEAAQLFAEISANSRDFPNSKMKKISTYKGDKNLQKLAYATLASSPFADRDWASLKLAILPANQVQ